MKNSMFFKVCLLAAGDNKRNRYAKGFNNALLPVGDQAGLSRLIEKFSDDIEIGVRVPVGLVYLVEAHNADIFSEIAPIVDFISRTGLEIHLLFGGRYYF